MRGGFAEDMSREEADMLLEAAWGKKRNTGETDDLASDNCPAPYTVYKELK
jgi:hypothetical protein